MVNGTVSLAKFIFTSRSIFALLFARGQRVGVASGPFLNPMSFSSDDDPSLFPPSSVRPLSSFSVLLESLKDGCYGAAEVFVQIRKGLSNFASSILCILAK